LICKVTMFKAAPNLTGVHSKAVSAAISSG
jgi:hypothetical protein